MRLVLIAVVACGHDAPPPPAPVAPPPPPADASHVGWIEMPRDPFVVGGIDITYTCTRDISRTRGTVHQIWADLRGNALVITDDEGDIGAPTSSPTHRHRETRRPLTAAQVTTIKQDLDHVLAGGPYAPETAGGECVFALTASGSQGPFFHIAKDTATTQDAVTTLVRDLAP